MATFETYHNFHEGANAEKAEIMKAYAEVFCDPMFSDMHGKDHLIYYIGCGCCDDPLPHLMDTIVRGKYKMVTIIADHPITTGCGHILDDTDHDGIILQAFLKGMGIKCRKIIFDPKNLKTHSRNYQLVPNEKKEK